MTDKQHKSKKPRSTHPWRVFAPGSLKREYYAPKRDASGSRRTNRA